MSSAWSPVVWRYATGSGSWGRAGTKYGSSACRGVIQADRLVANDLPRNGPSGRYSKLWVSRALQSVGSAKPDTGSRAACVAMREAGGPPGADARPQPAAG